MVEGIWGGIVTFNPDIERLVENICAIAPQVEHLVIFDNASKNISDIEALVGSQIDLIKSSENLGMAKALNSMAKVAFSEGATDILFLDQDSVASDDLVEIEALQRTSDIGIVTCLIVDRNVERTSSDGSVILELKRAITSGSLVNLSAWDKVGGYDEVLFVDWVDNEFCDNLRFNGYRILATHATSILHEMGNQGYAWSAPGRDYTGRTRSKRGYYRQNYPAWRWRDRARGETIAIRKYKGTAIMFDELCYFLRGTIGRILLLEPNKVECLKAVVAGCRSGRAAVKTKAAS